MPRTHRGPRINAAPTRADLSYGGRDHLATRLWDAVNYPAESDLSFTTYWTRFERTSELRGIINKFAQDTWQDLPEIEDAAETDDPTDFERDVEELFQRRGLRGSPKQWFLNADRMALLGEYSVLFLGYNDDRALDEPAPGIDDDQTLNGPEDLNFVVPYDQGRIAGFEVEEDPRDERYHLPTTYELEVAEDDTRTVHWSRVIHIPEGVVDNPLKGTPFAKPIFHELLNLDKIKAASGEGYWQGGYQGIVAQPPKGPDGTRITPDALQTGSTGDLAEQIRQHREYYQRLIATTADVETLGSDVGDPTEHYEIQWRSIASYLDAPLSILMGNETGERATQEDREMWHERIGGRRNQFGEPVILRPTFDRWIRVGVLAEPEGAPDDDTTLYYVNWKPLDEPSQQQELEMQKLEAEIIDVLSGGVPDTLASVGERRKVLDWGAAVGSEAPESERPADEAAVDGDGGVPPDQVPAITAVDGGGDAAARNGGDASE